MSGPRTLVIRRSSDESLGLVLGSDQLILNSVRPGSAAARVQAELFIGSTLIEVERVPVHSIEDVKRLSHGKTAVSCTFEARPASPRKAASPAAPGPTAPASFIAASPPHPHPDSPYYAQQQPPPRRPASPGPMQYDPPPAPTMHPSTPARNGYAAAAAAAAASPAGAADVQLTLEALEAKKREAAEAEDYVEAGRLKAEIGRLRALHLAEQRHADPGGYTSGERILALERQLAQRDALLADRDREIEALRHQLRQSRAASPPHGGALPPGPPHFPFSPGGPPQNPQPYGRGYHVPRQGYAPQEPRDLSPTKPLGRGREVFAASPHGHDRRFLTGHASPPGVLR